MSTRMRKCYLEMSLNLALTYSPRYEAFRALGPTIRGKIVSASSVAEADHVFVKYYMAKRVHTLEAPPVVVA